MVPIEVEESTNSAYVLKTLDGRLALYRVKLDGSMATELVYRNGKVDVDGVVGVGRGSRVIGVTFAEDKARIVYFDPHYEALGTALGHTLAESTAGEDLPRLVVGQQQVVDPRRQRFRPGTLLRLRQGGTSPNEILIAMCALRMSGRRLSD